MMKKHSKQHTKIGCNVFEDFLGSYISGKLPPRKQRVLGEKGINKSIEFNVNRF